MGGKPTQADVNAGSGGGWLSRHWDAAVAWLDKEFSGPKLTADQQAEAGKKAVDMSRDLANSDNPIVSAVTKNSGLTGRAVDGIKSYNARLDEAIDAASGGAPPPAAPPPKVPGAGGPGG